MGQVSYTSYYFLLIASSAGDLASKQMYSAQHANPL